MNQRVHARHIEVVLDAGTDERAPGGEVTRALCGSWEHEPPCRWPHHNDIEVTVGALRVAHLRTVFAAADIEAETVHARIEAALRGDPRWTVVVSSADEPTEDERALGERIAR